MEYATYKCITEPIIHDQYMCCVLCAVCGRLQKKFLLVFLSLSSFTSSSAFYCIPFRPKIPKAIADFDFISLWILMYHSFSFSLCLISHLPSDLIQLWCWFRTIIIKDLSKITFICFSFILRVRGLFHHVLDDGKTMEKNQW